MVRSFLIVLAVVGALILNACGRPGMHGGPVLDSSEGFDARKNDDPFIGKGERYLGERRTEDSEAAQKPNPDDFLVEPPVLKVDWATKIIRLEGKLARVLRGKEVIENVTYEGEFDSSAGATILTLKQSDKKTEERIQSVATFKCMEACNRLIVDVSYKADAQSAMKSQRLEFHAGPTPTLIPEEVLDLLDGDETKPTDQNVSMRELDLPVSGVNSAPVAPLKSEKKSRKRTAKRAPIPQEKDPDETVEGEDPAAPAAVPFLITEEMLNRAGDDTMRLADFHGSELFPLDLGPKYKGKAQGFYSRYCARKAKNGKCLKNAYGALALGTDVAANLSSIVRNTKDQQGIGFRSVVRGDRIFYGSGLLVKMIEEVGKLYDRTYPKEFFKVNDLSKETGGKVKGHATHQNGLDVDIGIPLKTSGGYDYKKMWTIVKSFVDFGYVEVIFLNQARIVALCNYLQKNEKDYQETFKKFYRESGHTTHMHVRLRCTPHNDCIESSLQNYTAAKFGVCK